jgi:hypothetical protein
MLCQRCAGRCRQRQTVDPRVDLRASPWTGRSREVIGPEALAGDATVPRRQKAKMPCQVVVVSAEVDAAVEPTPTKAEPPTLKLKCRVATAKYRLRTLTTSIGYERRCRCISRLDTAAGIVPSKGYLALGLKPSPSREISFLCTVYHHEAGKKQGETDRIFHVNARSTTTCTYQQPGNRAENRCRLHPQWPGNLAAAPSIGWAEISQLNCTYV